MFAEEFETLIEVKKSIIKKAVEGGVAKSSTLQVQTQRVDAKIEEAILQVQHLGHTFAHFAKAEADAVNTAEAPGGSVSFAEVQAAAAAATKAVEGAQPNG
jgi:stress response protein SCP2